MRKYLFLVWFVFFAQGAFAKASLILQDRIGVQTLSLCDTKRGRFVEVELWYPVTEEHAFCETSLHKDWIYPTECRGVPFPKELGKRPLILFSHGLASDRRERSWFAERLVREGFLVASLGHYKGTWGDIDPQEIPRIGERALDVSFVLTTLLQDPFWQQWIDREKIGFSGYSLGGGTGLLLSGAKIVDKAHFMEAFSSLGFPLFGNLLEQLDFSQEEVSFKDSRIKAYFLMAPCIWGLCMNSFKEITTKMHIVALEKDSVLITAVHARPACKLIPGCRFTLWQGLYDHYIFFNQATEEGKMVMPLWLHKDAEGVDRKAFHLALSEMGKGFFLESLF